MIGNIESEQIKQKNLVSITADFVTSMKLITCIFLFVDTAISKGNTLAVSCTMNHLEVHQLMKWTSAEPSQSKVKLCMTSSDRNEVIEAESQFLLKKNFFRQKLHFTHFFVVAKVEHFPHWNTYHLNTFSINLESNFEKVTTLKPIKAHSHW